VKAVLIVDDEPKIVQIARDYLENAGFSVLAANSGKAALASVRSQTVDLIVLDLGLPDIDGLDVCRQVRRNSDVPIVMLTARDEETDKLVGLELGADDYVTKPFSPKELVARVRAVFRRVEAAEKQPEVIRALDITLEIASMRLRVGERNVELTPTEFQLLAKLASQPGRIFTRSQLLESIHGVAIESYERAIDAHIKNLRRKIEPEPSQPRYILTVYGVGYRFSDET
jgi:two-component system, OmpR family, alkaline phosphatase synthesis response regulator PhoP